MDKNFVFDTDFHSHLLPDIDCSAPPEISAQLLRVMWESGIRNLVLTPHFYPHWHSDVKVFIEKRNAKIAALMEKVKNADIQIPKLFPAAEVLLCQGLERLNDLELLCIEGTKTLLIEMPDPSWNSGLIDTLEALKKADYDIVIAHADRYGEENASLLVRLGYPVQLNADSVCSFGKSKLCRNLAVNGSVVALGSDTHVSKSLPQYKKMRKASSALADSSESILKKSHRLIGIQ